MKQEVTIYLPNGGVDHYKTGLVKNNKRGLKIKQIEACRNDQSVHILFSNGTVVVYSNMPFIHRSEIIKREEE